MAHFGSFLKEWIGHRALSVPRMASISGVPLSTLKRTLAAEGMVLQERNISAIARVLGTTPGKFREAWEAEQAGRFEGFNNVEYLGLVNRWLPLLRLSALGPEPLAKHPRDSGRYAACLEVRHPGAVAIEVEDDSMTGVWGVGDILFLEPCNWRNAEDTWLDGCPAMVEAPSEKSGLGRFLGLMQRTEGRVVLTRTSLDYGVMRWAVGEVGDVWLVVAMQRGMRRRDVRGNA